MALSKTTQDHDEIRQWAESRGALPAEVASTESNGQTGIIRLEFPKAPNANDSALKQISWEEFFEKFDASGIALVYQEQTADGEQSNFNKLVHPENAAPAAKKAAAKGSPAKKSTSKKAAKSIPVKRSPAKKAPAAKAPVRKTSAKAPANKASAKKTPAKKTAAKTSTKKAPAKKSVSSKGGSSRSRR